MKNILSLNIYLSEKYPSTPLSMWNMLIIFMFAFPPNIYILEISTTLLIYVSLVIDIRILGKSSMKKVKYLACQGKEFA
jgi:hypothetical protein